MCHKLSKNQPITLMLYKTNYNNEKNTTSTFVNNKNKKK